ncbi:MAG: asparagine--tRNA ligase [Clostridiales bacterium]|nr:asparagine--tRNA ligase [Clostridiales bacterium]
MSQDKDQANALQRVLIKDIYQNCQELMGQRLKVSGWIRTVRKSKNLAFIELNDGSVFSNLQIVVEDMDLAESLNLSAGITVTGELAATEGAKQPFELKAENVAVEADCGQDYPIQKKRHTFEYLRTVSHLRPRTNTFSAVFRARSVLAQGIHDYFAKRGFIYVHTPIITGSDCEGAGKMFRVSTLEQGENPRTENGEFDFNQEFFRRETNLTVSGQLQAEAYALAFGNVYTFGPTFRAEKSVTARHAAEFWMIEPEIAFADLNDNMALAEDMTKSIIRYCLEKIPADMRFFNDFIDNTLLQRLEGILDKDFGCLTYTEAIGILEKADRDFEFPVSWGIDLQTEHERYLTEVVFQKPVFVIDYPKDIKAFYMRGNDDGKTVAAMDMLVPGVGELIGGSQREERLDKLIQRMQEMGMGMEDYEWYLELRRFGGVKHSGFGMGFERLLMYLSGMANIRDVVSFPRTYGHFDL